MADEKDTKVHENIQSVNSAVASQSTTVSDDTIVADQPSTFREETAAEIAAPVPVIRRSDRDRDDIRGKAEGGTGIAWAALALSILSLFVMPILFGAAGIVLGFIARRRGAEGLGAWAIGIGAVSIIIGIFILPFF
jgi:hypothetical protein